MYVPLYILLPMLFIVVMSVGQQSRPTEPILGDPVRTDSDGGYLFPLVFGSIVAVFLLLLLLFGSSLA